MSNWYLKAVGRLTATTIGKLDRYTDEHQAFLSSGYVCASCSKTLMKPWGVADVKCLDADDQPVPLAVARVRGRVFACPKCGHRWSFRMAR